MTRNFKLPCLVNAGNNPRKMNDPFLGHDLAISHVIMLSMWSLLHVSIVWRLACYCSMMPNMLLLIEAVCYHAQNSVGSSRRIPTYSGLVTAPGNESSLSSIHSTPERVLVKDV